MMSVRILSPRQLCKVKNLEVKLLRIISSPSPQNPNIAPQILIISVILIHEFHHILAIMYAKRYRDLYSAIFG